MAFLPGAHSFLEPDNAVSDNCDGMLKDSEYLNQTCFIMVELHIQGSVWLSKQGTQKPSLPCVLWRTETGTWAIDPLGRKPLKAWG
jgi:hypothetical protein